MSPRADLSQLSPVREPWAFVVAAVLSPDDPAMDHSDAALGLLEAERKRCAKAGGRRMWARDRRLGEAVANIRQLRKAKR